MKDFKSNFRYLAASALLVLSGSVVSMSAQAGDAVAGEAKAGMCGGCHGMDGNSEDGSFPRLAGQYGSYIVKQVKDFQLGHRANNDTMAGMAAMVATDQDAKDIGAFYQSQKIAGAPLVKPDQKLVAKGAEIFTKGNPKSGVYGCINCHGDKGMGRSSVSVFPIIGGQHRDYLVKQLKEFREGGRANDPAGMMSAVAKNMTDGEIDALAEYLAAQM